VDTLGLILVVMFTAASVQDRPGGKTILTALAARFPSIALIWADGGYANRIDSTLVTWAKDTLRHDPAPGRPDHHLVQRHRTPSRPPPHHRNPTRSVTTHIPNSL
jgi:hypothetical protein